MTKSLVVCGGCGNNGAIRRYFIHEKFIKTFAQASLAFAFSIGGMFSGRIVSSLSHLFIKFPWVIVLYPSVLTLRGDIGGVLSGKLSTMLHTGQVKPSFSGNTVDFYSLIKAILMLIFIDSLGMSVFTLIINFLAGYASFQDVVYFLLIPLMTCLLATFFSMPITMATAFASFKRGLDPDIIVYPVIAIISDVIVALCYLFTINFVISLGSLSIRILAISLSLIFVFLFLLSRNDFSFDIYISTLREASPTILLTSLGGVLAGTVLASLRYTLELRPEILVVYPVLLNALGGFGSIIGSITTTRLALGYISSSLSSIRYILFEILTIELASLLMHIVYGLSGFLLCLLTEISASLFILVVLCMFFGLVGPMFMSLISFSIGVIAFNRGWDPDNLVIPLVSSCADIIGTILVALIVSVIYFSI